MSLPAAGLRVDSSADEPPSRDSRSHSLTGVLQRCEALVRLAGRRHGVAGPDLDELEQDVRIRLWRALAGGARLETVRRSYVYRAARSAALDLARRRSARPTVPLVEPRGSGEWSVVPPTAARPDEDLERAEGAEAIARAVEELTPRRRLVVRLHLTGYERGEIARLLNWSEATTRNLLYRGLADLRVVLRRRGIGR